MSNYCWNAEVLHSSLYEQPVFASSCWGLTGGRAIVVYDGNQEKYKVYLTLLKTIVVTSVINQTLTHMACYSSLLKL